MNTIVVKRKDESGRNVLQGRNTDCIGISRALTASRSKVASSPPSSQYKDKWAFVIGGGGTTRAAVYALSNLGIARIFLINRDASETETIIASFPNLHLSALSSAEEWTEEHTRNTVCGVGAIPSIAPQTEEEHNVYRIARKIFHSSVDSATPPRQFLEMAYKPRRTLMLTIAEEAGWQTIGGAEAMIEQGLAQSRVWLETGPSADSGRQIVLSDDVVLAAASQVRRVKDCK
ncbi:hypothetical protein ACM66B_006408 [Microbotryomycetes sp. NB124-2]